MCFHNKFTSSKLFYNTESFLCCFKNFVGKVVTMNTQAQSEARSEFLQHDLLYALDFLTHCSLQVQQVPSVMLNHLYLKVTPNENHTGLNQVSVLASGHAMSPHLGNIGLKMFIGIRVVWAVSPSCCNKTFLRTFISALLCRLMLSPLL